MIWLMERAMRPTTELPLMPFNHWMQLLRADLPLICHCSQVTIQTVPGLAAASASGSGDVDLRRVLLRAADA
jgi:hypothetical protein